MSESDPNSRYDLWNEIFKIALADTDLILNCSHCQNPMTFRMDRLDNPSLCICGTCGTVNDYDLGSVQAALDSIREGYKIIASGCDSIGVDPNMFLRLDGHIPPPVYDKS